MDIRIDWTASFRRSRQAAILLLLSPVFIARLQHRRIHLVLVAIVTGLAACSDDGGITTPTSATDTTTTVAEASTTEEFVDVLQVDGSAFYSFSIPQLGTVNITLDSVGGPSVPSTAWLGLGLGQPSGTDCATTSSVNTPPGAGPHLTGTYETGVYCVRVWDIGNLYGPAAFRISIAHP